MTDTLQLIVWRQSVCAGDDIDAPHELVIDIGTDTLHSVAERLLVTHYLASFAGGCGTWALKTSGPEGRPLAVLAQQWSQPRCLVEPDTSIQELVQRDAEPHLYLQYVGQVDPDQVFDRLKLGGQLSEQSLQVTKQRKWWQFWK